MSIHLFTSHYTPTFSANPGPISLQRSLVGEKCGSQELPIYLGFFEFVHNVRKRGKALLGSLVQLLVAKTLESI